MLYFKVHDVCTILNLYHVCICNASETVIHGKKLRKNLLGFGTGGVGGNLSPASQFEVKPHGFCCLRISL